MPAPLQYNTVSNHFCAQRLERVFATCFAQSHRTRLTGGAEEPLYQPAVEPQAWSVLHYRADYFASALHEVAHWCIAGNGRRCQVDFGYWYNADGRNADQQRAFEAVECKPQALEWFFSKACRWAFSVSVDNLTAGEDLPDTRLFKARIVEQAMHWQATGLPHRADIFYRALSAEFGTAMQPEHLVFGTAELM